MKTDCRICGAEQTECRNINLYVTGSEGLTICHDCEMMLVTFVRNLLHFSAKNRIDVYKRINTQPNQREGRA